MSGRFASKSLRSLTQPERVSEVISTKDKPMLGLISGALGAICKGGKTVTQDEHKKGQADHYFRVINGLESQNLKSKDYEKIAGLVSCFLSGS